MGELIGAHNNKIVWELHTICLSNNSIHSPQNQEKLEPQGALIAHLSTMSTSVIN